MLMEALHRPLPLRQQVYHRLRTALRAGEYRPKQRLTEIGVASALGVSRTPVREALGLLSWEGLLSPMTHGGFMVPEVRAGDLKDIFELRFLLEPYAAGLAAHNAHHQGVQGMHESIQSAKQCLIDTDNVAFLEAGQEFRRRLFAMAGNRRLVAAISQIEAHVQFVRADSLDEWQTRTILIAGQEQILNGVRERSAEAAAKAMRGFLTAVRNLLLTALDQHEDDDPPPAED